MSGPKRKAMSNQLTSNKEYTIDITMPFYKEIHSRSIAYRLSPGTGILEKAVVF